jgi:hypothetical protein
VADDSSSSDGEAEGDDPADARPQRLAWLDGHLADGLAVVVVLAALFAGPPAEVVERATIWHIGRFFAGVSGLFALWGRMAEPERGNVIHAGALLSGAVGIVALLGRNFQWHFSPFAHTNPAIWGLPSALAFAALSAGALALYRRSDSTLARGVLAAALPWTTAVVFLSHWWLREASLPFYTALDLIAGSDGSALSGLVLFAVALPVFGGWLAALTAILTGERDNSEKFESAGLALALAAAGVPVLIAHHLIAPIASGTASFGQIASSVLVAALLGLLTAVGTRWVAVRAERAFPDEPAEYAGLAADILVPGLVLVTYVLLKIHGMGPSETDENIYFYMAYFLAERGCWPFVDYFFAHPPLHVLIPGFVFEVVGYSHTLAKQFSVWAGGVSALAVWAIARRHIGRLAAAVAMIGLVFGAQWLKSTTLMTGVNLTVMFMVVGFWLSLSGRMIWAGISFGLAASTGFYSAAAICAALALGFFDSVEDGSRQLGAFAAVFGTINLAFWFVAGDAFLDGVYVYHSLKSAQHPEMMPIFGAPNNPISSVFHNLGIMLEGDPFSKDLHYHPHLWLAGLLMPVVLALAWLFDPSRERATWEFADLRRIWEEEAGPDAKALWIALVGAALFVQYAMFRELFSHYWTLIHPLLALALGYVVYRGWEFGRCSIEAASEVEWTAGLRVAHLASAIVVFGVLAQWQATAVEAGTVFSSEVENAGDRNDYEWRPAPVLPSLSGFAKTFFWKEYRLKGNLQRGYLYYLWTKKRDFATLPEIADWVRERTEPDETIAGASTSVPLIALRAERRIAAGEPDTNNSRFETGMLEESEYWRRVCEDNLKVLVTAPGNYFSTKRMGQKPIVQRWFSRAKVFEDPQLKYGYDYPITLWERTGTASGEGVVCEWE